MLSCETPLTFDPLAPSLTLAPHLVPLREKALERQAGAGPHYPSVPELRWIEAAAWAARPADEPWLTWRARRVYARLDQMPLEIEAGETVVGRPRSRPLLGTDDDARQQEADRLLADCPPYPGGDAAHFHPDHAKLLRLGIGGLLAEIDAYLAATNDPEKQTFYRACRTAMQGMQRYAERLAETCAAQGMNEQAAICRRVASAAPATFHEALQLMWIAIIALWHGEDHGLTTPGRMDQTLRPFYERDLAAGRLTPDGALQLICCLYIQCNRILQPGSAIAVMVGGRDRDGQDVTNDLTFLCLIARQLTRLVYPTVGIAWHPGTPEALTRFACRMLATGIGDPAFFNDPLIANGLRDHGVAEADCTNYMNSTCVEIKVCGASNMWVTAPYFNLPRLLLEAMDEAASQPPADFAAFDRLVRERVARKVSEAARQLDEVWRRRAEHGCFPLASCLIADCLARGLDYDRGGARYHWVENSFVGLANLVDGLAAIRRLVFADHIVSLDELRTILSANWEGHEPLRQRIANALPHYGNDDPAIDALAADWADFLATTTESNQVGGHRYVPGFFCWIMHERLGADTGATPDGRRAGLPFADGAGAAQGRERRGPTASVLSTTSWSHRRALGGLVHNVKFASSAVRDARGQAAMWAVLRTFLERGGFEIQVNVVGAKKLRDAQAHPEQYRDLIVRVAGYSDYFVHLNRQMQDEVIARTEFEFG